jgi:hypothetical protein
MMKRRCERAKVLNKLQEIVMELKKYGKLSKNEQKRGQNNFAHVDLCCVDRP